MNMPSVSKLSLILPTSVPLQLLIFTLSSLCGH